MAKSKVTKKELQELQGHVRGLNDVQIRIGQIELDKVKLFNHFTKLQSALAEFQKTLEVKYGTVNVNIQTGEINEADTKN